MLHIANKEELFDIMTDKLMDGEESINFISDSEGARDMMRLICKNTEIVPDLIQFNTEEDGYYYVSIDYSEFDGISFSITSAQLENGDFFGLQGIIYVDNVIPKKFDECVKNNKHIDSKIIRIEYLDEDECDGDCDNCPHHNNSDVEYDEDGNVTGFTRSWKEDGSNYSFSFHSSDSDYVKQILEYFI